MVIGGNLLKTIVWFDTGWGYSARIVELLRRYHSQGVT
jgi:glyceraldehyde-3-phosphate dehydrogenase/erythrose-4-phosphate dehydrogenase